MTASTYIKFLIFKMYFNIKLFSKNKKSLNIFCIFFNNLIKKELNFEEIMKCKNKRRKKTLITTLKSPHINKKSKDQYEMITYSKNIKIYTKNSGRLSVLIKKLKNIFLSDISLKVEIIYLPKNNKNYNPLKYKIFNNKKYVNSYMKMIRIHNLVNKFNTKS